MEISLGRPFSGREIFQNLVFPEGIYYDREKHEFRTPKVNYIFELIAHQAGNLEENGKATSHLFDDLSPAAEREGNEPNLQYVEYQIIDLPAKTEAMNWLV